MADGQMTHIPAMASSRTTFAGGARPPTDEDPRPALSILPPRVVNPVVPGNVNVPPLRWRPMQSAAVGVVSAVAAAVAAGLWMSSTANPPPLRQADPTTSDWINTSNVTVALGLSCLAAVAVTTFAWICCGPKRRNLKPRKPLPVTFIPNSTRVLFIGLPGATAAAEYASIERLPRAVLSAYSFSCEHVTSAVELAQVLLASDFDILHLSGLGMAFGSGGELDVDTLGRLLKKVACKLVIFNACGTAQSLQRFVAHCHAVAVGTTASIDTDRAIEFSMTLYARLATKDPSTGAFRSFAAALHEACNSLDKSSTASYLDANPEQPRFDRGAPFFQSVPRALTDRSQVALYLDILSRARSPLRFCSFTFVGKDTLHAMQAWGVQYDLSDLWSAGSLATDLKPILDIHPYRRPQVITGVSEQRQATYYVNVFRAVTGNVVGPCLFAVADGDVYYHGES